MTYLINVALLWICYIFLQISAQLQAPTLSIDSTTHKTANISFSEIDDAASYEVMYTAQHNTSDSNNIPVDASQRNFEISNLRSNINYLIKVRAIADDGTNGAFSEEATARTAPNGASILQTITTPTFITVFLEHVPGALQWEVQYSNATSRLNATMIEDLFAVIIIRFLAPNSEYFVRARVTQLSTGQTFSAEESPFGTAVTITTDRLSAFGRVKLVNRVATGNDNSDQALISVITAELLGVSRNISNEVEKVTVLELEGTAGSNITCHYEIVLNVKSVPSTELLNNLSLNSGSFNDGSVRFEVYFEDGYSISVISSRGNLRMRFQALSICNEGDTQRGFPYWTLFDGSTSVGPNFIARSDDGMVSNALQTNVFSNTDIRIRATGDTLFNLSQNTIYGIRHNYLIHSCIDSGATKFYDRQYQIIRSSENAPRRYTILYTTGILSINSSLITYTVTSNLSGAILTIPSNFVSRAFRYNFTLNNTEVGFLSEDDLDSSESYLVSLSNLTPGTENNVTVTVISGGHRGDDTSDRFLNSASEASSTLTIITEIDTQQDLETFNLWWIIIVVVVFVLIIIGTITAMTWKKK